MQGLLDSLARRQYRDAFEAHILSNPDEFPQFLRDKESILAAYWVEAFFSKPTTQQKSSKNLLVVVTQKRVMFFAKDESWSLWSREGGWAKCAKEVLPEQYGTAGCPLEDIRKIVVFRGSHRVGLDIEDTTKKQSSQPIFNIVLILQCRDEAQALRVLLLGLCHAACRAKHLPSTVYPDQRSEEAEGAMSREGLRNYLKESSNAKAKKCALLLYTRVELIKNAKKETNCIFAVLFDVHQDARGNVSPGYVAVILESPKFWRMKSARDTSFDQWTTPNSAHFYNNSTESPNKLIAIEDITGIYLSKSSTSSLTIAYNIEGEVKPPLSMIFPSCEARFKTFRAILKCKSKFGR